MCLKCLNLLSFYLVQLNFALKMLKLLISSFSALICLFVQNKVILDSKRRLFYLNVEKCLRNDQGAKRKFKMLRGKFTCEKIVTRRN